MKKLITKLSAFLGILGICCFTTNAQTTLTVTNNLTDTQNKLFHTAKDKNNGQEYYYTFSNAFSVNNSNTIGANAFSIAISIDASDVQTSATINNMGSAIYNQYQEVLNGGVLSDYYLDLYYRPFDSMEPPMSPDLATIYSPSKNKYNLNLSQIYCSGLYKITISPASGYSFDPFEIMVNVYPDLTYVYANGRDDDATTGYKGKITLNINGIPQISNDNGYDGTVTYPYFDGVIFDKANLANQKIYTPGLYFAELEYILVKSGEGYDASNYKKYDPETGIDLSNLESQDYDLYLKASKFGANTPNNAYTKLLITSSTSADIPTGVEGIGAESEGEAVYYNLQGVKVANPEHGIFVKVAGGKATKVIL